MKWVPVLGRQCPAFFPRLSIILTMVNRILVSVQEYNTSGTEIIRRVAWVLNNYYPITLITFFYDSNYNRFVLTSAITIVSSFLAIGLNCTILINRRRMLLNSSFRRTLERYCSSRSSICRSIHATQKSDWILPNHMKNTAAYYIIWQMLRNGRISIEYLSIVCLFLYNCDCVLVLLPAFTRILIHTYAE